MTFKISLHIIQLFEIYFELFQDFLKLLKTVDVGCLDV